MLLPFEGSIGMNNDTTSRRYTSQRCQLPSLFVLAFEGKESDALSSIAVRSLSSLCKAFNIFQELLCVLHEED
jgi:hypothetical protein